MAVTDFSSAHSSTQAGRPPIFSWSGWVEFIVGGGSSLLLLPLFLWLLPDSNAAALGQVSIVAFWASWVINDPHFLVSYQIFYRDFIAKLTGNGYAQGEQVRYWAAGVILPLGMLLWIAGMFWLESRAMAAGLMQLMFILVGWHYVKQGYGVLSVLSARRGVFYSALESNLVVAHALIAWLYTWFGFNMFPSQYDMSGVAYYSNALGQWPRDLLFWPFVLSGMAAVLVLAVKFWRARKIPPLAAILGLFVSVELWVVWSNWNQSFSYFIPALHSIQYLFFVYLLERGRARSEHRDNPSAWPVWAQLARVAAIALLAGWICFHWLPNWLDGHLGRADAAYGAFIYMALFTAFINIHHFAMDNVMWRKGNPDMRYLKN